MCCCLFVCLIYLFALYPNRSSPTPFFLHSTSSPLPLLLGEEGRPLWNHPVLELEVTAGLDPPTEARLRGSVRGIGPTGRQQMQGQPYPHLATEEAGPGPSLSCKYVADVLLFFYNRK